MAIVIPEKSKGLGKFGWIGNTIKHRDSLSANDSAVPSNTNDAIDLTTWKKVKIQCFLGGTSPTWDITPCFWNASEGKFCKGEKITISEDSEFIIETYGVPGFYVLCDGKSGTTPTISVYVIPVND